MEINSYILLTGVAPDDFNWTPEIYTFTCTRDELPHILTFVISSSDASEKFFDRVGFKGNLQRIREKGSLSTQVKGKLFDIIIKNIIDGKLFTSPFLFADKDYTLGLPGCVGEVVLWKDNDYLTKIICTLPGVLSRNAAVKKVIYQGGELCIENVN